MSPAKPRQTHLVCNSHSTILLQPRASFSVLREKEQWGFAYGAIERVMEELVLSAFRGERVTEIGAPFSTNKRTW